MPRVVDGKKICTHCKLLRPVADFQADHHVKSGLRSWCQFCLAEVARKRWPTINTEVRRQRNRTQRLKQFGITQEEYDQLYKQQGGVCAICGQPEVSKVGGTVKRLSVDHSHKTDVVRGILCGRCNSAIGLMDEDLDRLESAKQYLVEKS